MSETSTPHSELVHEIQDALVTLDTDYDGNRILFAPAVDALTALRKLEEQLETLREAATALYERVEMDESVGVCLSSRFESLNLGSVLSNPASERCPVCEGLDQPGLLHNERAPYCSQAPSPAKGNMGGVLHQERADHLRRAAESSPAKSPE